MTEQTIWTLQPLAYIFIGAILAMSVVCSILFYRIFTRWKIPLVWLVVAIPLWPVTTMVLLWIDANERKRIHQ